MPATCTGENDRSNEPTLAADERIHAIALIIRSDQFRRQESYIWPEDMLEEGAYVWDADLRAVPTEKLAAAWSDARGLLGPGEKLHPRHLLDAYHAQRRAEEARAVRGDLPALKIERREATPEERARHLRMLRETGCAIGRVPKCYCSAQYDCQNACDRVEEAVPNPDTGELEDKDFWVCHFGNCDFRKEVEPLKERRRSAPSAGDPMSSLGDAIGAMAREGVLPQPEVSREAIQHEAEPLPMAATG